MNKAEIQLQFPRPGEWNQFTLTAVYRDGNGFVRTRRFRQEGIPADQAPALAAVVSALVGLAEPWQASQVWARLVTIFLPPASLEMNDGALPTIEAVELTVEAVNAQGGRRMFTTGDYPEFIIADPAAVVFFRYFTDCEPINS